MFFYLRNGCQRCSGGDPTGPGQAGAQQRPSLPPRGRQGAVGPAEGRGPGLCWGRRCFVVCAVPCDRSEFVTPPPPPGSASPLPLPAPARPRPLHPPRGGAGGGEGLPGYLGLPSPAPLRPGRGSAGRIPASGAARGRYVRRLCPSRSAGSSGAGIPR